MGIIGIITFDKDLTYLIAITDSKRIGKINRKNIFLLKAVKFLSFRGNYAVSGQNPAVSATPQTTDVAYMAVEKFLLSELFYYSYDYHLTLSFQKQEALSEEIKKRSLWKVADRKYFWNYYLQRHFIKKRLHDWILPIIRGYVGVENEIVIQSDGKNVCLDLALISRISCMRAGTRYNARGINDDGNVANFVETEQIISVQDTLFSFLQTRGSVPVFWQQRLEKANFKVELTRTREATQPAFKKHFDDMLKTYKRVHVVNLLSGKSGKENLLTVDFKEQLSVYLKESSQSARYQINFNHWDFNKECGTKFGNVIKIAEVSQIKDNLDDFRFFMKNTDTNAVFQLQNGIFRINCLDCLDRTNVVMSTLAKLSIPLQLSILDIKNVTISSTNRFGQAFQTLWANNGDSLSCAYAGTGAMKSTYTREDKTSVFTLVDDGIKSAKRAYINYFNKDSDRQDAIDLFLGNIDDQIAHDLQSDEAKWIAQQLKAQQSTYALRTRSRIYVGSWNVNDARPSEKMLMDSWISPEYPNRRDVEHDKIVIYLFGFQEIVELNANSIVKADEGNMEAWVKLLREDINLRRKESKVVLARSVQLVGLALIVFVQEDHIGDFRNFTIEKSKVATQGLTGNKGALITRFDFCDTSVCCVCAHLTAGQKQNEDRIQDVKEISALRFQNIPRTPHIYSHDYIFWFGDLNFRIDLPYQDVIGRISREDFEFLYRHDQLNKAMKTDQIFKGFKEGAINFAPTYKYEIDSDVYDTKRVPAWCDRILFKSTGNQYINQLVYSRGEIYISDHRPIKALFEIDIKTIDKEKKEKLEMELYKKAPTLETYQLINTPQKSVDVVMNAEPTTEIVVPSVEPSSPTTQAPTTEFEPPNYVPPPPDTKTQKDIKLYCASLASIKQNLSNYATSPETVSTTKESLIISSANLFCHVIAALIKVLESLRESIYVNNLMVEILELYKSLGETAKIAINSKQRIDFNDFTATIERTIKVIEQHLPYLEG
uniref:phosphoinositide 5-phosphatase n=1 Tax=Arcella intermedia TaxID=1963864 RepID=A0A6B2KXC7_9EUKA